jgi:hypothetical protein
VVYSFTRSGTTWTQRQELTSDVAEAAAFGSSILVSGNTLAVGAFHAGGGYSGDSGTYNAGDGAVFVFTSSGTTWSQQQKLTASAANTAPGVSLVNGGFGYNVAVSADTLVVSASTSFGGGPTGEAFVFTRSGTTWTLQRFSFATLGLQIVSLAIDGHNMLAGANSLTDTAGEVQFQDVTSGATATVSVVVTNSPLPNSGIGARTNVAIGIAQSQEYFDNLVTVTYNKYLGRAPRPSELPYWVNQLLAQSLTDEQLEAGFIGAPEYIADHGGLGAGWITGMYLNLLGRTPAAGEVQYWVNQLNSGLAPAAIAFGFAASQERESQRVQADYQLYVGRSASSAEVPYWVNFFLNGGTNEKVGAGFVASDEYFKTHGNSVGGWLVSAYRAILNRLPDNSGLQYWEQHLQ